MIDAKERRNRRLGAMSTRDLAEATIVDLEAIAARRLVGMVRRINMAEAVAIENAITYLMRMSREPGARKKPPKKTRSK